MPHTPLICDSTQPPALVMGLGNGNAKANEKKQNWLILGNR